MRYVSVIIPTYNRWSRLERVLTALADQHYPFAYFEVIVISDGSTDGTNDALQQAHYPFSLRAIVQENQGAAAARNRGLAVAEGDLTLFLDDDVLPSPGLIQAHIASHNRAGAAVAVLGPMLNPPDVTLRPWVRWEQVMLYKQYAEMSSGLWEPTARQFFTGNASVARHHLLAVGGFDRSLRRAEDVELAYRLADQGVQFVFNPDAIGYHYAERSFPSWLRTPYEYGHNDVIFAHKHGQDWLLKTAMGEFNQRHWLVRQLVINCLSRPSLTHFVTKGLNLLATSAGYGKVEQLANHAYSGIFHLQYYQGMADTLGGRQQFLRLYMQHSAN